MRAQPHIRGNTIGQVVPTPPAVIEPSGDPPPAALYSGDSGNSNPHVPWISVDAAGNLYIYNNLVVPATFTAVSPSGDTTGATDTAAIQAAINSAASVPGAPVTLAAGIYYVNQPLVNSGTTGMVLRGQKGGNQSGSGAGTNIGTVIKPVAAWSNVNALPISGVISIINAKGLSNTSISLALDLRDVWIDGSSGPASVDGVAAWGAMHGITIMNVGLNKITGNGIAFYTNTNFGSANFSQGPYLNTVICQAQTGIGVTSTATDATFINVHVQSGTGDGWKLQAGNCRLFGCRADLSTTGSGFTMDAARSVGTNSFFDAITMVGCGTQGNNNNGLNLTNSSATGQNTRTPVLATGCSFDGDGVNGGAGGGGFAGVAVAGRNMLFMDGCFVLAASTFATPNTTPQYAITTASIGSGPGVPDIVSATGGFLNANTALTNDAAPTHGGGFLVQNSVMGYSGGMYNSLGVTAATLFAGTAITQSTPTAPSSTTSATLVMMGLGTNATGTPWAITPTSSGKVLVTVTGLVQTAVAVANIAYDLRRGTGTAPSNGAAVVGTRVGSAGSFTVNSPSAGIGVPFAITAQMNITANTAYWFDLTLSTSNAADAASFADVSFTAVELS